MNWPYPLIVLVSLVALLFLLLALFDPGIIREWFASTPLRRGLVHDADERRALREQASRKRAAAHPGARTLLQVPRTSHQGAAKALVNRRHDETEGGPKPHRG
jgi:hypothetical protein